MFQVHGGHYVKTHVLQFGRHDKMEDQNSWPAILTGERERENSQKNMEEREPEIEASDSNFHSR